MLRNRWVILVITVFVLLVSGGGWLTYNTKYGDSHIKSQAEPLQPVKSVVKLLPKYDVIVVGTDPEGITAAVSAARNGLKTLLVDGKGRQILGGLMTLGWLNTIDMDRDKNNSSVLPGTKDAVLNKGIFSEWFAMIEGDSFDVSTAANAFYKLVQGEKNIDLMLQTKAITPILANGSDGYKTIQGINITKQDGSQEIINASAVIDATQDADIAYAAGAPFTNGLEDLGDHKSKMAVTLVFRLKNVTPEVWKQIRKRLDNDGDPGTGSNETSAWGYSGMRKYKPLDPKLASMRGLNIGRQNDQTILSNSLLLYNVDVFDPISRQSAIEQGQKELPHIVAFMKETYPEFAYVELDGTAPELYVRETRHMIGEYRLSIVDLLENKDQWDRIAFGSYESDLQPVSPNDSGNVVLQPNKYAIPFRSIIPQKVDGLLVVGRSASYDTLAHGSARVIPTGMAEGEAAGAAVKVALENQISFRQMSQSKERIAEMQSILNKQGMDLKPYTPKEEPYMKHKDYDGLKAAVYVGIASGSYGNVGFNLDKKSNDQRVVNQFITIKKKYPNAFPGDPSAAIAAFADDAKNKPVSLAQLSYTIVKAMNSRTALDQAQAELQSKNLITAATIDSISNKDSLTDGDVYMVFKDVLAGAVDLHLQ